MIVALCTYLTVLAAPSLGQDSDSSLISPCPNVFTYEQLEALSPRGHRWYGVINLTTDRTLHGLTLNILLDDKVNILGNRIGIVTTKDNKNVQIENASIHINPGPAFQVPFFVQYNKNTPRLTGIRLNEREICQTTNSPRPVNTQTRGSFSVNGTPLDRHIDEALKSLRNPKSTNTRIAGQPQCGHMLERENHWPWQIALHQMKGVRDSYICGGTLVTARHVITAAHCVTEKSTDLVVDRSTLGVFLGKRNLWTSIDGVQVKDIRVHPHYNASIFCRNVAILELSQPAVYTDWVRPACLWPKNETDLKSVIGKKGLVLSWGFDGKNELINELNEEEMPVVSQPMCSKSDLKFVQSEYTYCAGNRNEGSPCAGGGSGMVFKLGSTWHLRGLTSLAAPGYGGKRCDTTYYVVFTDLAKFLPWIYNIVYDF